VGPSRDWIWVFCVGAEKKEKIWPILNFIGPVDRTEISTLWIKRKFQKFSWILADKKNLAEDCGAGAQWGSIAHRPRRRGAGGRCCLHGSSSNCPGVVRAGFSVVLENAPTFFFLGTCPLRGCYWGRACLWTEERVRWAINNCEYGPSGRWQG
jgi:hypothetical protein